MSAAQTIPHEDRGTYLGSHDTSAVFGLNPYMKPINVYMNKLGMSIPQEPSERMEWGLRLEPVILARFGEEQGVTLESTHFVRHSTLSWFGGTPDGLVAGRKAGVDAKNIGWNRGEWGEPGTDQMPEYILMQCHHFMTLLDYDVWFVAVLFGGNHFVTYEVERDREISDMIVEADGEFWRNHIEAAEPPSVDGSESYRKFIERKFPQDNGEVRAATPDEISLLELYRTTKTASEEWSKRLSAVTNQICDSIGDSAGIASDDFKVSYRWTKPRSSMDTKRLREELPEIVKQYGKTGTASRPLKVTFKGEDK